MKEISGKHLANKSAHVSRSMTNAVEISRAAASRSWTEEYWRDFERRTRAGVLSAPSEAAARKTLVRAARTVLRSFSSSFFIVTRFLPPRKRGQVELIYAAVRYPDEVVDTFPLTTKEKLDRLNAWETWYDKALAARSVRESIAAGAPCFVAAFAQVVRDAGIPRDHYRAFLSAMRHDAAPRHFSTLDDLIDSYIYGSAVVVGYFLAHVYGPQRPGDFERALAASRNLGIALQLTNFLRDVSDDRQRRRLYLPLDLLRREGVRPHDAGNVTSRHPLKNVVDRLAKVSDEYYHLAARDLDAFSADCRSAIKACIEVYRQLNDQITRADRALAKRQSVPLMKKFKVLPASKYWRLPLAYLARE
jgi:phytoene synthase